MNKHTDLVVTVDGEPVDGRVAEHAILLKSLVTLASRVSFARRTPGGSLAPVPDADVELHCSTIVHHHGMALPDSIRGVVASVASVGAAKERAR